VARIEAGTEEGSHDLGDGYLDGGGILLQGEIDVIPGGVFRFGPGMRAGVEIDSKPTRREPAIGIAVRWP
jgi:hypothetical protein